jgi:LAO/AO transport system kinase
MGGRSALTIAGMARYCRRVGGPRIEPGQRQRPPSRKTEAKPVTLEDIRIGGKVALARALAVIERAPDAPATVALLDAAYQTPLAHVIGMTGPPGVGKSTLMNALIAGWRGRGRRVGCIAVDPSSRRSGGALLGDRTRLATDPDDDGIFVRSMAARDRLGGLAALTVSAMVLMRALYDIVLIETVGVGQSETDVATVADSVVFCVQPGSGDSLQFMKAGIAEIPHLVVVTKADMAQAAERARADVEGALSLAGTDPDREGWRHPALLVSAAGRTGVEALIAALDEHAAFLDRDGRRQRVRAIQAALWLTDAVRERFGREGVARAGTRLSLPPGQSPFQRLSEIVAALHLSAADPAS